MNLSFTRNYNLICSIVSSLVKPQMKYKPNAEVFKTACYRNYVSAIIPTFFQSKSFTFRLSWSQSHETKANVAISPKILISSMLVLIPAIHENNWYINCLCPFFTFTQWKRWSTFMIHRLFSRRLYWLKTEFWTSFTILYNT